MINLAQTRDELMPTLRLVAKEAAPATDDLALEIILEYQNNAVVVKGYNTKTKRLLGFAITQEAIENGSFRSSFKPNCLKLFELLTSTETYAEDWDKKFGVDYTIHDPS